MLVRAENDTSDNFLSFFPKIENYSSWKAEMMRIVFPEYEKPFLVILEPLITTFFLGSYIRARISLSRIREGDVKG